MKSAIPRLAIGAALLIALKKFSALSRRPEPTAAKSRRQANLAIWRVANLRGLDSTRHTEGIEDALSIHAATGLGVWGAGSAGRMPALADKVPEYIECVTVVVDADASRK